MKKELLRARADHLPAAPPRGEALAPLVVGSHDAMEEPADGPPNRASSDDSQMSGQGSMKMGKGMKAKLYRDIDSASAIVTTAPGVESVAPKKECELFSASGELSIQLTKVLCSQLDMASFPKDASSCVYWTVQWGDGSVVDRDFQSDARSVLTTGAGGSCEWEFESTGGLNMSLSIDDHLCFEFYQGRFKSGPQEHGRFLGSTIYPIEDLLLENQITTGGVYHIEEAIGSDDGASVGQIDVYVRIDSS